MVIGVMKGKLGVWAIAHVILDFCVLHSLAANAVQLSSMQGCAALSSPRGEAPWQPRLASLQGNRSGFRVQGFAGLGFRDCEPGVWGFMWNPG